MERCRGKPLDDTEDKRTRLRYKGSQLLLAGQNIPSQLSTQPAPEVAKHPSKRQKAVSAEEGCISCFSTPGRQDAVSSSSRYQRKGETFSDTC